MDPYRNFFTVEDLFNSNTNILLLRRLSKRLMLFILERVLNIINIANYIMSLKHKEIVSLNFQTIVEQNDICYF